ncbi:GNAT family N-acetyltransferase [Arthrobacter jiangjiafuii]|uniref:GNAT family N-acetyltransferase n=1 Tax=Arthrobacter jiangjiafuii TaxID=2817475 RepID=A0A975QYM1_9MICC|nr:GNAT family N-acetyltransferase [Arthrobacter jiangjiafuii]MBP3043342.1 GNAT family N-acetyltransferase [Arthrobacter jiangjiafuii]QWC08885.1 GNAT family N-acetyltransferase [Arthrobacter jiangjiafuii]
MELPETLELHKPLDLPEPLVLHTLRLTLRPYTSGDLAAVHRFASDPRLTQFVEWGPNTLQDSRGFLAACLAEEATVPRQAYTFALTLKDGGAPFGSVGLTLDQAQPDLAAPEPAALNAEAPDPETSGTGGRTAETGYVIAAEHWNRGYATEAAAAVVHFGFTVLGLDRISATCRPGNEASARVLEKTGMVLKRRLPAHKLIRGQWEDSLLYSMARPALR